MGSRPKKKWGQNFLRNPAVASRIVEALEPEAGELILEIGPGEGVLTRELVRYPNPIVAIEIDPDLTRKLELSFGGRIELRNEDATRAPLPPAPFCAVGNLPYYVATPIVRRVVADRHCRRAVFMFQKEVADRILASPGDESYGFLTLAVRLYAEPRLLVVLNPGSFYPPPKVRSAVVVLDRAERKLTSERQGLEALLSAAFRMRRKKLVNNLIGFSGLDRAGATEALERAGIDEGARAEVLSLEELDRLAAVIAPDGDGSPR